MQQQNQGKITIQQGQKTGYELVWGSVIGERGFRFFGEAKEMLETIDWETAELICGRKLEDSYAVLVKVHESKEGNLYEREERILLYFIGEEQRSIKQDSDSR